MTMLRIASFNVENLFARPRLFTDGGDPVAAAALRAAAQLQRLLDAKRYNTDEILSTYNTNQLGQYLEIQCARVTSPEARSQRFFFFQNEGDERSPAVSINRAITGRGDWIGGIRLKGETLSGNQVKAIASVIRKVNADIIALCEVESRQTLETFNREYLSGLYPYAVLIEGNDTRGIDVGLMSKHPVGALRTNVFTPDPAEVRPSGRSKARLFNRDCLEVMVDLPDGKGALAILVTHLKSKRGTPETESETDGKRLRQSAEIARIIAARYSRDGKPFRVIVAGDLNETPDRNGANGRHLEGRLTSIDPLLVDTGLSNILADSLGKAQSFTHIEERDGSVRRGQIDYLLVSPDVRRAAQRCGLNRSGQAFWGAKAPPRAMAASDHACLYVDLDLEALASPDRTS